VFFGLRQLTFPTGPEAATLSATGPRFARLRLPATGPGAADAPPPNQSALRQRVSLVCAVSGAVRAVFQRRVRCLAFSDLELTPAVPA
jgi:hypothetical protein